MRGVTVRVATLWPLPTSSAMAILAVVAPGGTTTRTIVADRT